jgi:hypothetical protein
VADGGGGGISWESTAPHADGPDVASRIDAARIVDSQGQPLWINLDHVTRISPGLDPREPATVRFARERALVIPAAQGRKLSAQLNRCCVKRKEK